MSDISDEELDEITTRLPYYPVDRLIAAYRELQKVQEENRTLREKLQSSVMQADLDAAAERSLAEAAKLEEENRRLTSQLQTEYDAHIWWCADCKKAWYQSELSGHTPPHPVAPVTKLAFEILQSEKAAVEQELAEAQQEIERLKRK